MNWARWWYGKRTNLKAEVMRNQSKPNFPKRKVSGGKKFSFFGKFVVLFFLLPPFWNFPYCLIIGKVLNVYLSLFLILYHSLEVNIQDTGRKLNVPTTFRGLPERLLNVLCTFNLRLVSRGNLLLGNLSLNFK